MSRLICNLIILKHILNYLTRSYLPNWTQTYSGSQNQIGPTDMCLSCIMYMYNVQDRHISVGPIFCTGMFHLSGFISPVNSCFFSVSKGDSIECMYLQEKDRMVFKNSTSLGVRKDLHGVLLLDTALQTPAARPEDVIKLELPLAEVIKGSSIHPPPPSPGEKPVLQCSLADSFVVIF